MDIQELLQFIYLLIFTVVAVFIAFLCVDFKVCHECTRTWWGLHFMLNSVCSKVNFPHFRLEKGTT